MSSPAPPTTPTPPTSRGDSAMSSEDLSRLLDFLRERDVACPLCGYNLRDLTCGQCPECRHPLALTVGIHNFHIMWFVATVAPGIFSGIAAVILLIPLILAPLLGGGGAPWGVWLLDGFGWLSGIAAIGLLVFRIRFLRLRLPRQRSWAGASWLVHLGACLLFLLAALL